MVCECKGGECDVRAVPNWIERSSTGVASAAGMAGVVAPGGRWHHGSTVFGGLARAGGGRRTGGAPDAHRGGRAVRRERGHALRVAAPGARGGQRRPRPHGGGRQAGVDELGEVLLCSFVAAENDLTLKELTAQYRAATGVALSQGALWRALGRVGLAYKKSHSGLGSRTGRT